MGVILLFGGLMVGSILTLVIFRKRPEKSIGILWIDKSGDNQEQPDIFLQLSKEVSYISDKKHVTLDVNVVKYNSQK